MKYKVNDRNIPFMARTILTVFPPVLILLLWEFLGRRGVINQAILPYPTRILNAFISQAESGKISANILASLARIVKGFLLGILSGILLGIVMGLFGPIDKALSGILAILRPIPIIALIPFFILWLGIGEESKVAVIFLGSLWPVLLNTIHGIKSTDRKLLEVSEILRKNYFDTVIRVIIPSALPVIINGIRLAAGSALMGVVTAEMIAASKGLGYMIMFARELSQADVMLVGVIIIGLLGLLMDKLFTYIGNKVLR